MTPARRVAVFANLLLFATLLAACANPFGREYEYEEQLYLSVGGSATVIVNASLPALVALRALPIDPNPRARFDPLAFRRLYESRGCDVLRVGAPWFRHGRRFVQIRLETSDVSTLSRCGPLGWSTYTFTRAADGIHFNQRVGASTGNDPGKVNWTGKELVAFRMHVPSKVLFHNVRRLSDNATGQAERGNILTWEQRLQDRRAGAPLDMQVIMDPQSILHRTLWLFGGSFVAALLVMALLIWWTVRKGKARARRTGAIERAAGPESSSRRPPTTPSSTPAQSA
jgi:hypothetical protein